MTSKELWEEYREKNCKNNDLISFSLKEFTFAREKIFQAAHFLRQQDYINCAFLLGSIHTVMCEAIEKINADQEMKEKRNECLDSLP